MLGITSIEWTSPASPQVSIEAAAHRGAVPTKPTTASRTMPRPSEPARQRPKVWLILAPGPELGPRSSRRLAEAVVDGRPELLGVERLLDALNR